MKRIIAAVATAVMVLVPASPALANGHKPKPETKKVTLCHATPPASAKNGWNLITVSKKSVIKEHGHDSHAKDIIPPFDGYAGKNWDETGQAIFNNGCKKPGETPSPTTTTTAPSPTVTETTTTTVTSPPVTETQTSTVTDTSTVTETGTVTLPPTTVTETGTTTATATVTGPGKTNVVTRTSSAVVTKTLDSTGRVVAQSTSQALPDKLAYTGGLDWWILYAALALVIAGGLAYALSRKPGEHTD